MDMALEWKVKSLVPGKNHPGMWFCILFMTSFLAGCGSRPVWMRDDPCDVLAGFLQTTEYRGVDEMWEYLSAETRQRLDSRAQEFNAMQPEGGQRRGCDMIRAGHVLSTTREYKKLELAFENDRNAVVKIVLHDGNTIDVAMHRDAQRWAIDLPLD